MEEAGSEEQEAAEVEDDPAAEHTMVQGVLDSLLKDNIDEDVPPQVTTTSYASIEL